MPSALNGSIEQVSSNGNTVNVKDMLYLPFCRYSTNTY